MKEISQNVPRVSGNKRLGCNFYVPVKYSSQISSVLLYQKWQLLTVLMEVIFAITLRNMKQILSLFSVIIRRDLSIKCVKAFPTTFQLYFHFMLLS